MKEETKKISRRVQEANSWTLWKWQECNKSCTRIWLSRTNNLQMDSSNETVAKDESGKDVSQADINAMKKRIAELEMENEILKKATAIFAKTK